MDFVYDDNIDFITQFSFAFYFLDSLLVFDLFAYGYCTARGRRWVDRTLLSERAVLSMLSSPHVWCVFFFMVRDPFSLDAFTSCCLRWRGNQRDDSMWARKRKPQSQSIDNLLWLCREKTVPFGCERTQTRWQHWFHNTVDFITQFSFDWVFLVHG